jgi:hypothetical protein
MTDLGGRSVVGPEREQRGDAREHGPGPEARTGPRCFRIAAQHAPGAFGRPTGGTPPARPAIARRRRACVQGLG